MADEKWLRPDGYLKNVDFCANNIVYHPHLNVILIFTKNHCVKVLDVNSGAILQSCQLSNEENVLNGRYIARQDRILIWDGKSLGYRGDYNGVLLLDTILQKPIVSSENSIKVELLVSEAVLFLQSLKSLEEHGLEATPDVINELTEKITEAQACVKTGIKAQKWNIVCLEFKYSNFKLVSSNVMVQLKKQERHIPALSIASAINERLSVLLSAARFIDSFAVTGNNQRYLMSSEAARRDSFAHWPHMDYQWALPDQMAQAGFYHNPNDTGDDRAMCFTCNVCLVSWEKTDEPWCEHERHSPTCPFVKGEYTQNVPLSVTYATAPAIECQPFDIISKGDDGIVLCTADSKSACFKVWSIERTLSFKFCYNVSNDEALLKSSSSSGDREKSDVNFKLSALATYTKKKPLLPGQLISKQSIAASVWNAENLVETRICCGTTVKFGKVKQSLKEEEVMNIENQANSEHYGIKISPDIPGDEEITTESDNKEVFLVVYKIVNDNVKKAAPNLSKSQSSSGAKASSEPDVMTFKSMVNNDEEFREIMDILDLTDNHNFITTNKKTSSSKGGPKWKKIEKLVLNGISEEPEESDMKLSSVKIEELQDDNYGVSQMDVDFQTSTPTHSSDSSSVGTGEGVSDKLAYMFKDDKNSGKDFTCVPVQCISLGSIAPDSFEVVDIIPSHDQKYLLVVLKKEVKNQSDCDDEMDVDKEESTSCSTQLVLFKVNDEGMLESQPQCVQLLFEDSSPVAICMLPGYENDPKRSNADTKDGVFVMTCADGTLKLLSLKTLRTISEASIEGEKFIAATYCKSLDRMCGCTENGSLHFYSFYDNDGESGDEHDDHNNLLIISDSSISDDEIKNCVGDDSSKKDSSSSSSKRHLFGSPSAGPNLPNFIAYKPELGIDDLKSAYQLTQFEKVLTPYSAEVPVCWNELVVQKVRRPPQNLKPGDDIHLSKTWRLHRDGISVDEHLIELSLSKSATLGHIDLKYSFYQPCEDPPKIQVTLLKQISSGFGYRMKTPPNSLTPTRNVQNQSNVDENIEFNLNSQDNKGSIQNPVLTVEYLQSHNAEIVCGPIEVSACMDLTEQHGTVTLTSPKLFRARGRNYFIHTKTMTDPIKDENHGCDWLHEISINVRSVANCKVRNDKAQRCAILESNIFLTNILKVICKPDSILAQNMALDILNWIVSIRMTRFRNVEQSNPDVHSLQKDCVKTVSCYLRDMILECILNGDRSIAHKCVKIVLTMHHGVQNMDAKTSAQQVQVFEKALGQSIQECLMLAKNIKYAGSLRWLNLLICETADSVHIFTYYQIAEKCINLLLETSTELERRYNPYSALLRTRFGLYGLPFELELFDVELPLFVNKSTTHPVTLASIIKTATSLQSNTVSGDGKINIGDNLEMKYLPIYLKRRGVGHQIKGILEVTNLHFSCVAASEATRLEQMEQAAFGQKTNLVDELFEPTVITAAADNHNHKMKQTVVISNGLPTSAYDQQLTVLNPEPEDGNILTKPDNAVKLLKDFLSTLNNKKMSVDNMEEEIISNSCQDDSDDGMGVPSGCVNNQEDDFVLPWHKLLTPHPKQMIVIERMHPGARRFVTLDFGMPVLLTDFIIPACDDLTSIVVDIWCLEENMDCTRLVSSIDIGSKPLIISDLQPPPLCRYLKITITGKYGMSATRCRIPVGSFYGHAVVLEGDTYDSPVYSYIKPKTTNIGSQLKALHSLFEDVHCKYSLASSKLKEQLDLLLKSDTTNLAHLQTFFYRIKDSDDAVADNAKILSSYEECLTLQHQLNMIRNVMERLERGSAKPQEAVNVPLSGFCSDKLRVLSECLVEILMHFIVEFDESKDTTQNLLGILSQEACTTIFNTLILSVDMHIQLSTCSFLVKVCYPQPWWGDFLANTLTTLFSFQNNKIFPQDRIFFLLTYLGRKSIMLGTDRSLVIDHVLRTLAKYLIPLSKNSAKLSVDENCPWIKTDMQLIGWLMLFLSVCLDDNGTDRKDQSNRWDFMTGESDLNKTRNQPSNSNKMLCRSFKKRYFCNKYANNVNEKMYMMQTAETVQVSQLSSPFELSIKQETTPKDNHVKKTVQNTLKQFPDYINDLSAKQKFKIYKNASGLGSTSSQSKRSIGAKQHFMKQSPDSDYGNVEKRLLALKPENTILVIRGLVELLLQMDFSCNMDLFLLTCKVIAQLVSTCYSSIQLSMIVTSQQLQKLINMAVWKDQQHPWAIHAITCLLQDMLDTDKNFKGRQSENPSESASSSGSPSASSSSTSVNKQGDNFDVIAEMSDLRESGSTTKDDEDIKINNIMSMIDSKKMKEFFEENRETKKEIFKTKGIFPVRNDGNIVCRNISNAMDARLEYGLESCVEYKLRKLSVITYLNMFANLTTSTNSGANSGGSASRADIEKVSDWPEYVVQCWSSDEYNANNGLAADRMLIIVFDTLFTDLYLQESWLNLEQTLHLWLTLNGVLTDMKPSFNNVANGSNSNYSAGNGELVIPLSKNSIDGLLSALTWYQTSNIKIRTWCLAFQCLTLACNMNGDNMDQEGGSSETDSNRGLTGKHCQFIINHPNFEKILLRFYSGSDMVSSGYDIIRCVGPTVSRFVHDLYKKIQSLDGVGGLETKSKLKKVLLQVTSQLLQPNGAISNKLGPIDAQNELIRELLSLSYDESDIEISMSIIESVAHLIHNHIINAEKVYCQKTIDAKSYHIFNSIYATVFGSDSKCTTVTKNSVLINLLKLVTELVMIPLNREDSPMDGTDFRNECQTDEIKAEQANGNSYLVDEVVKHFPTMNRLLGALLKSSGCYFGGSVSSSVLPSLKIDAESALAALTDQPTVSEALLNFLWLLSKKANKPELIVQPLFEFLNSPNGVNLPRLQLSEPFLWFMLRVLDSPETVGCFARMGGISILCNNLVCGQRNLVNVQPGLVSMIMQHLSKSPIGMNQPGAGSGASKKTSSSSGAALKSTDGLINFAPFSSISSENSTVQQADVLIQVPIASHRRARTAAWSYLFYKNQSFVDLTITFPTAVLVKEVHLQPHLPSLASCPYAVAVEITRDSSMPPIPISQPMSTVGMTCIKLNFTQPEIATSMVLRLYRPKDSSTIGLTQISVFGTTTFSDGSKLNAYNEQQAEEQNLIRSNWGWLRILARCFSVVTYNSDLDMSKNVIKSASEYPGFLEACCALLNVSPHVSSVTLHNLETVLLKMGLHSCDLGLRLIKNLLYNSVPQMFKLYNDTICDLLFDLCTNSDPFTKDRIEAVVLWTQNLYSREQDDQLLLKAPNRFSGFILCIASILWTSYSMTLIPNMEMLITNDLFQSVYQWTTLVENNDPFRKAIDSILCSICAIRPEMFQLLLKQMGVLIPNPNKDLEASISDDRKEANNVMDYENMEEEWYSHLQVKPIEELHLTREQLLTISMSCQSQLAVQQLIDSGLPKTLSDIIIRFSEGFSDDIKLVDNVDYVEENQSDIPMGNIITCTDILDFFSDICSEGLMRDWLGSEEGSRFWQPLLSILCHSIPFHKNHVFEMNLIELENALIRFFSRLTTCHARNQDKFTEVLVSVIKRPSSLGAGKQARECISGFTRRMVLQLLLESERIVIAIHSVVPMQIREAACFYHVNNHPSRRPNSHNLYLMMNTNSRVKDILDCCSTVYSNVFNAGDLIGGMEETPLSDSKLAGCEGLFSNLGDTTFIDSNAVSNTNKYLKTLLEIDVMDPGSEFLSVAAGVTAKDKRLKDVKNQAAVLKAKESSSALKSDDSSCLFTINNCAQLVHPAMPHIVLTPDTTISQIIASLVSTGNSMSTPTIQLNLVQGSKMCEFDGDETPRKACDFEPTPTPLQVFSKRGGLSLLAHYLPTIYPEGPKPMLGQQQQEKDKSPPISEWVKIEPTDEIYEDLDDTTSDPNSKMPAITTVPPHSLSAFGLFLKLPPYADVLLRDKVRAQCLLRLILGVSGDGEGNEIYSLSEASTLPTLPFEVFRQLLDGFSLTSEDGVVLRQLVIEIGAIHMILNCLGVFTHQAQYKADQETPSVNSGTSNSEDNVNVMVQKPTSSSIVEDNVVCDDKSHVYWAKGTGFGTGSTQQSWDVEQALLRQKSEEEQVTVLLQIISSYVNPGDLHDNPKDMSSDLPAIFFDLLKKSCLIAALCSYLRNDSVLDITRHIPLYRAILQLLRAISLSNQLVSLLSPQKIEGTLISIVSLLENMKTCVDTYASRLKVSKKSNIKGQTQRVVVSLDDGDDEGLALLIPDIHETYQLVMKATNSNHNSDLKVDEEAMIVERPIQSQNIEQRYMEAMKKLQFDTFEMITESENGYRFLVSYHFESNMRAASDRGHPARVKRLAQETVTLSTSLPLSYSSSVFVRCDADRLDVMKVLITGPADTPYANGCFEFDVFFPPDYPNSPMMINLETTGRHSVRFNPNLYNDGKVCLSVLNTWHGRPEEKWNAQTSSFLQVLVSIQSLILVPEPYFNEPGFERSRGTPTGTHSSREYNSNIYQACARWAMLDQIKNPNPCFKEVIHTHFWLKRHEICKQIEGWINELSQPQFSERNGRTITFNSMVLRRQYRQLREELAKIEVPKGLEDLDQPFSATIQSPNMSCDASTSTNTTLLEPQQPFNETEFLQISDPAAISDNENPGLG